jgi:hypothetical protein
VWVFRIEEAGGLALLPPAAIYSASRKRWTSMRQTVVEGVFARGRHRALAANEEGRRTTFG